MFVMKYNYISLSLTDLYNNEKKPVKMHAYARVCTMHFVDRVVNCLKNKCITKKN